MELIYGFVLSLLVSAAIILVIAGFRAQRRKG
jgi:hypothetical protein